MSGTRRVWTCAVCGRVDLSVERPRGWTTGHLQVCGADCLRHEYEGMAIAHLFPADATPEEERALREHEDGILTRARTYNPTMAGRMRGSVFRAREERETARGR